MFRGFDPPRDAAPRGGERMKWNRRIVLIAATLIAFAAAAFAATQLTVQVSSTRIRKDGVFWAPSVAKVGAGERLTELSRKGDWIEVRTSAGERGWIHSTAVTTKKVTLGTGSSSASSGVSADEVSLAGKGFTEDVEKEYRKENADLDFDAVDRMSGMIVSDDELIAFLKEGKLAEWGGKGR